MTGQTDGRRSSMGFALSNDMLGIQADEDHAPLAAVDVAPSPATWTATQRLDGTQLAMTDTGHSGLLRLWRRGHVCGGGGDERRGEGRVQRALGAQPSLAQPIRCAPWSDSKDVSLCRHRLCCVSYTCRCLSSDAPSMSRAQSSPHVLQGSGASVQNGCISSYPAA